MSNGRLTSGEVVGLTDGRPRLPRIGKIHLGIKDRNSRGVEFPRAVDYFVFDEQLLPTVKEVFGKEKPRELDVLFPVDEVTQIAPVAYKKYSQTRGLVCTSDGEVAHRIVDEHKLYARTKGKREPTQEDFDDAIVEAETKDFSMRQIPCPARECRFFADKTCKAVMNLQFLAPKWPGFGVFQLDTGSINSILNVRGGLELARATTGGRIAGIPFKLGLEPVAVYPDGKKKIVQVLKLIPSVSLEQAVQIALRPRERVFLPLPAPSNDIEEALYPKSKTQTTEAPAGPTIDGETGEVIEVPPTPASPPAEPPEQGAVAPPRSEPSAGDETGAPEQSEEELVVATAIEGLFEELKYTPKMRNLYRKAYMGRGEKLLEMLQQNLAQRKVPAQ